MDETWVSEDIQFKKYGNVTNALQAQIEGWSTGLKIPSRKNRFLIVTHIGSDSGFLENEKLTFQLKRAEITTKAEVFE